MLFRSRALVWPLWILCEIAIIACDLAEVLGAAIGLQLLFGVPILTGVLITALDVLLLLALSRLGMRRMEAFIITLVVTIGGCFAIEMILSRPEIPAILRSLIPRDETGSISLFGRDAKGSFTVLGLSNESLYIAMGILGATVMPHNLYLHSALVQSRAVAESVAAKREACKLNLVDSAVALNCAFFVNAAILVLAAAVFHSSGNQNVAKLEDAHRLLAPLLGTSLASTLFAIALLTSGQASTITGTLAGQIVMEGFLHWRIRPWMRRMISRSLAIIPAVVFISIRGTEAVDDLLVLSQVVLSMQLSFAVIPLISFTSDREKMGEFVNKKWVVVLSLLTATIIVGLNASLVIQQVQGWFVAAGPNSFWLWVTVVPIVSALVLLLAYIIVHPWLRKFAPPWTWATEPANAIHRTRSGPPLVDVAPVLSLGGHHRIAVALELGASDHAVLDHLQRAMRPGDTELILMHVVESAASRYLGPETSDQESREDRAALEAIAARFRERGISVEVLLGFGNVSAELARLIQEHKVDLLVAGSHGHRMLGDLIHGETTSSLRHRVRCPVLIVPAEK